MEQEFENEVEAQRWAAEVDEQIVILRRIEEQYVRAIAEFKQFSTDCLEAQEQIEYFFEQADGLRSEYIETAFSQMKAGRDDALGFDGDDVERAMTNFRSTGV